MTSKSTLTLLAAAGLATLLALPAHAAGKADPKAEQLARDSGCMSCHAIDKKVVGPAFKSVAEKYKNEKDAVATLTQSVRNGSKGTWGRIPMPAHSSLAEADVKTIVTWVLAQ